MEKLKVTTIFRAIMSLVFASVLATAAHAQASYQIKPGDTLQVEVLEDPNLNRRVLILPDGTFNFPLVGAVSAGGSTVDAVAATLSSALAPNFASPPSVFVSIGSLSAPAPLTGAAAAAAVPVTIDAFIMGEIANPGKIAIAPGTTILQMLAQAGGPTQFAATKRIELRRTDPVTGEIRNYRFNYLGRGGGQSIKGSTPIEAGDVVVVPQRRLFE